MCLACSGDDDNDGVNCTLEARAGLTVKVTDAESGAILQEGVTVTAIDGGYEEVLMPMEGTNDFAGAWERQGTYIVTVVKDGYIDFTSEPVTVDADVCHVITENITVALQPE